MIADEHGTPIVLPPKKDGTRLPPHLAPRLSDTSAEAEAVLINLLRELSPAQRVQRCFSLSAMAANLSRQAIQRARPDLSSREVGLFWVELHYGQELAVGLRKQFCQQE